MPILKIALEVDAAIPNLKNKKGNLEIRVSCLKSLT